MPSWSDLRDFCIPISVGLFLKSIFTKCVTHCFWGPFSSANMQPKHIALTGISVNDATSLEIFLCNGVKLGFHPSSHQFTDLRKWLLQNQGQTADSASQQYDAHHPLFLVKQSFTSFGLHWISIASKSPIRSDLIRLSFKSVWIAALAKISSVFVIMYCVPPPTYPVELDPPPPPPPPPVVCKIRPIMSIFYKSIGSQ